MTSGGGEGYEPAEHESGFRAVPGAPLAFDAALARQIARQQAERPPGRVAVHRWYLRRDAQPVEPPSWPDGVQLLTCRNPPPAYYRFLYASVGEPWVWWGWLSASDAAISEKFDSPVFELTALFLDGAPQGFFELERRAEAPAVELSYFGLAPWAIGQGLGPQMLRAAVAAAGGDRRPMTVNTCTLDHPKAMRNYQRAGFDVVGQVEFFEPDQRLSGDVRRDASPHMPLGLEVGGAVGAAPS